MVSVAVTKCAVQLTLKCAAAAAAADDDDDVVVVVVVVQCVL
jgi:hypothetical protein